MKPIIPFALLGALFAVGANAATTDPVGYVSLGDTDGASALPAGSQATLSVPLLEPIEATASVDSAAGSVITVNETLTLGEFDAPATGAPYMVEIGSGTSEGMFAVIASNTATEITVMLGGGDDLTGLANADSIKIRKAWTVGSLLPSAGLPDGLQLAAFDNQPSINNSADPLYLVNAGFGGWINGATFTSVEDAVVYPGESFVLLNQSATDISDLVVTGEVPLSNSRVRIAKDAAGAQDTRIGYVSPVSEVLDDAGFVPAEGDQILVYEQGGAINASSSQTLIFNTGFGGWIDGATFTPVGATFTFEGGAGYVYRRHDSAPVGDQVISNEQSYISTL